jgi:hypothetical protein
MAGREGRRKGVMHTMSNRAIDLANFTGADVSLTDIATSLSKICRFNGHINRMFTVAEHSIIGCRLLQTMGKWPEAFEFLLHDTGEAYTGDIILPLKELFPELEKFEDVITGVIFDVLIPGYRPTGAPYEKSGAVAVMDTALAKWESMHLSPTLPFTKDVWDTRDEWVKEYSKLRKETYDLGLEEIFIREYHIGLETL